jgi:dipeptidyl aminopeptidase/acylaminoacyl peptidase
MMRRPGARPRRTTDPYGIGPIVGLVWPAVAVVGLILIAFVSIGLMNGQVPFLKTASTGSGGSDGGGPVLTPAPSNRVIVPTQLTFPGSIAYAKAGNIWIETSSGAQQLTDGGEDSMPAFSPDGQWVYFIRSVEGRGKFPNGGNGSRTWYDLSTPNLMRIKPDGSGVERLLSGRFQSGGSTWFFWMREPTPSPDGKSVMLITDGPNPLQSDIVLKRFDVATRKIVPLNLPQSGHLGHEDPAWRPDGKLLVYVRNGRDGPRGVPQLDKYDPASKRATPFTGPGYLAPAFSPDGRFVAATKTDAFGTDVVLLDATGKEILEVTDDHHSFSPVWSPAGNAVSFLHLAGTIVDLRMATLDASTGRWAVTKTIDLTKVSGLDGASRPSWFVPPAQLPAPSSPASAAPSSPGSAAPGASASSAP